MGTYLERLRSSTNNDQRDEVNFGHDTKPSGLIDSLLGHFRDKPGTTTPTTSRRTAEGHGDHRISTRSSTEHHSQARSSVFKQEQNKKSQTSWFSSSLPRTKNKESSESKGSVVQNKNGGSLGVRNGDSCLSEVPSC